MTMAEFVKQEFGYDLKTTYWDDFSIADKFGAYAIKDTFKNAFRQHKGNYIYLTELVMVLGWKAWQHYQKNDKYSQIYQELYYKADDWAKDNLNDNELTYYYKTID